MSFARGAPAFWFIEITLDGETLRHSNAFEDIVFAGETYQGIGTRLTPPRDIDRAASLKSQKFTLKYDSSRQTDNDDPVGIILDSNWKRRPIRARYAVGAMGEAGYDFSDPFLIADESGRIKNIADKIAAGDPVELEMEIESGALIFLERRNQTRSPANQRAAFPDDAFFDLALKLDGVTLPWRTKRARQGTVRITYDVEGAATRQMLFGRGITKGSFVFGATVGEQRKFWNQVYALADHRCEALEEIYINGNPVLDGVTLAHGVRTELAALNSGGPRLWVTWYDGRHDQTANAYLISETASQPLKWTTAHRGRGVSYVIMEHAWDSDNPEAFEYEFVLQGARIYRERADTTAGGTGSHRVDDPDTWAYTTNAADIIRHFLRGFVVSPSTDFKWFGVGAETAFLDPFAVYEAQAEHCEEAVALSTGGTQPRYEINGWISAADDHAKNLTRLAGAMVADPVDEGGRVSIRLSEPQDPVIELTDDDLAEDEETVIGANARADDVVNRIEGRWLDPGNKFQAIDYPAVSNAAFELVDGEEVSGTWNQDLEISEERAQRKATLYLNKTRRTVELEETFGVKAKDVRPGDWITRKSALRGFPSGKLFVADEVRRFIDGTVRLILLEVDPSEAPWEEENAAITPATSSPEIVVFELDPPEPTISPVSIASGGAIVPGLTITREEADDLALTIGVEIALDNGIGGPAGTIRSYILAAQGPAAETISGLLPATAYVIRFRYIDGLFAGAWSDWETFTTTADFQAASALAASPEGELAEALGTAADARERLAELILSLQVRLDETRANLAAFGRIDGVPIGTIISNLRTAIANAEAALATELDVIASRVNDAEAAIVAETLARTTALLAESQARALLSVRLQNLDASILSERTARVTADESLTQDLVSLEGQLQDVESGQAGAAAALAALTTRVRTNELGLTSQSSSLTQLAAQVTGLSGNLTGQALSIASLTSRVRSNETTIEVVSSSVTSLTAEVAGLNSNFSGLADALSLIEAAILETGGSIDVSLSSITSLASQIESLAGNLSGQTSAVNALTSRVTATEGGISAVVTDLTSLSTTLDGLQAQVDVIAGVSGDTESGLAAFLGLRGRAGTSQWEFAAFAGTGAPSTIEISADQIRFNGAVIINGTLTTQQLASDAATERALFTGSSVGLASNAAFTNILSGNVPSAGGDVELEFETDVILTASPTVGFRVEIVVNGTVRRVLNYYLVGLFTHTVQGFARFTCSDGDSLVIRAKVQRSEGVGQAGASVANVTARSIEFKV